MAGRRAYVLARMARGVGHDCTPLPLDLADPAGIRAFENTVTAQFSPLYIRVDNAGNTVKRPLEQSDVSGHSIARPRSTERCAPCPPNLPGATGV